MVKEYRLEMSGHNLKRLIKESGCTQDEFAYEFLDKDPTTLRRWLSKGVKSLDELLWIKDFFDVSWEELFN